jgi:hypothetical protein
VSTTGIKTQRILKIIDVVICQQVKSNVKVNVDNQSSVHLVLLRQLAGSICFRAIWCDIARKLSKGKRGDEIESI